MAVVISLNRFLAPVDDTVTSHSKTQVTSHKSLCTDTKFCFCKNNKRIIIHMIIPRTWFFLSHVLKMLLVEHAHLYTVWRFVECGGCANRPQTCWGPHLADGTFFALILAWTTVWAGLSGPLCGPGYVIMRQVQLPFSATLCTLLFHTATFQNHPPLTHAHAQTSG